MKLVMFGGTFNPPHAGHVALARGCVEALAPDELLIVPDRIPPHKELPAGSASPAQRMEMCRLAFGGLARCRVSDLELRREGASYTVETLRTLRTQYPDAQLWLLMGPDMLASFPRWRAPEEIVRMARLAVGARGANQRMQLQWYKKEVEALFGPCVDLFDHPAVEVSSTELRAGGSPQLLPPGVADYVRENGLYLPALDELRSLMSGRLPPKRRAHTLGCEQLAAELAELHGADGYTVRAAALLHDLTKPLSAEEQLKLCEKWSIITDYPPEDFAALIHADTAAAEARQVLRMPERVCRCIARHTVGAPGMNVEEQILYIADLCEPTRTYEGAAELRALARQDLRRAVIAGMEQTVRFVRAGGREPYAGTLRALEDLKGELQDE